MNPPLKTLHRLLWLLFAIATPLHSQPAADVRWQGVLRTAAGTPIAGARLDLTAKGQTAHTTTQPDGSFAFPPLPPRHYTLLVVAANRRLTQYVDLSPSPVVLTLSDEGLTTTQADPEATGKGELSSHSVSELPLNKRDFSQLLLLAAGTMTDANGATNFTQQFAINGQRGVEATFAMDGADISDPEMGGSTFSNYNVDAVQEIQSQSGFLPAQIGDGAAGFTNIVTRSGRSGFHGSFFEFLRNSAFDARNYFDHPSIASPGRLPPFRRNEFGLTNGGAIILPHLYNGAGKTFYFAQYQGFRQVLGTTQVFPVPTAEERAGLDSTAFPGDVLTVPIDPAIARVLARYPLPNNPTGSYGVHTYASSSPVVTHADQFSLRLDHRLSERSQLFARGNINNLNGPTTNADQTVIDPAFGVRYIDHQRNLALSYTFTANPRLVLDSSVSITRSTPSFPTQDKTDPGIKFNDGSYEPFNSAAGTVISIYGNLLQARQNVALTTTAHAFKAGAEVRLNRDSSFFGISPNGEYDFGGGTAYAPTNIPSQSGQHDIHSGDPLPDTLTGLLTGSPFVYTAAIAPSYFSGGDHIGAAADNRSEFAVYAQDTWKLTPRFVLDYGLRYELYTPITDRAKRTSGIAFSTVDGHVNQTFVINPQPGYRFNLNGFAPRVQFDWLSLRQVHVRAAGAITILPPNLFQDNSLTGSNPFAVYPRLASTAAAPIPYGFQITSDELPRAYTPSGQDIFAKGSKAVPGNTVMDLDRYQQDLAALSPSHRITPLSINAIYPKFGNAYLQTWSLGLERRFGDLTADAAYIGTAAVHLARQTFFNGYNGADPTYAPYSKFDAQGNVTGGFGTENVVTSNAHSSYHALQTSLQGTVPHGGPGVQASYTWSKALDETSSVVGGFVNGASGAITQTAPQNPFNTHPEKGPATFDVAHAFTLSLAQDLHGSEWLRPLPSIVTAGWELLSISSINSGAPFTVYSGEQQTGAGSNGTDRPDQVGTPHLSTARKPREDYFGLGANNASYFNIPIHVPGGTGPNQGRFGTLGRDTFRGPAYYDFDFALIKSTPIARRASGIELMDLQFRAEFFNLFNIANLGLPANTLLGSGFGEISHTAGTSRQIQFSLKLIY